MGRMEIQLGDVNDRIVGTQAIHHNRLVRSGQLIDARAVNQTGIAFSDLEGIRH